MMLSHISGYQLDHNFANYSQVFAVCMVEAS